jgi:DNA-3-methyladenine glycosylase I
MSDPIAATATPVNDNAEPTVASPTAASPTLASPTVRGEDGKVRCRWSSSSAEMQRYHDEEWGRPLHGDQPLYEKMCLEGFQAGLSWSTILNRRPGFRQVFHDFDPERVALMGSDEIEAAMLDARIIRNRAKILSTIKNATLTLELCLDHPGALDALMWSFAPPKRDRRFESWSEVPAVTDESTAMSKSLRKLGFGFVGPTTMYALMQSSGMVDDHVVGCWRAE